MDMMNLDMIHCRVTWWWDTQGCKKYICVYWSVFGTENIQSNWLVCIIMDLGSVSHRYHGSNGITQQAYRDSSDTLTIFGISQTPHSRLHQTKNNLPLLSLYTVLKPARKFTSTKPKVIVCDGSHHNTFNKLISCRLNERWDGFLWGTRQVHIVTMRSSCHCISNMPPFWGIVLLLREQM